MVGCVVVLLAIFTVWPSQQVQALPEVQPTIPKTIPEKIEDAAKRYGVPVKRALCIAKLESGFNPKAKNKGSTAGGIYQFINSTWVYTAEKMGEDWSLEDKFDEDKNIEAGVWLLSKEGNSHWAVAPSCP